MALTPLQLYKHLQKQKFQEYIEPYVIDDDDIDYVSLSRNPNLDIHFLLKYHKKPWCWLYLSQNPAFSKTDKEMTKSILPWADDDFTTFEAYSKKCLHNPLLKEYFTRIYSRESVNIVEDVKIHTEVPWNWQYISYNQHITEEFVLEYISKLNKYSIASNKALKISFFIRTKHMMWPLRGISMNPNLTEKDLKHFFNAWHFRNPEIQANLSENEGISLDFILQNLHLQWNLEIISVRNDITKEHIIHYPTFPWRWEWVSGCPSVCKHFLKKNPFTDFREFYYYHHGLTVEEVKHLHPKMVIYNRLEGTLEDKLLFLRKKYAVRKIENAFYRAYWFPEFAYCRRRLNKRYDDLFNIQESRLQI